MTEGQMTTTDVLKRTRAFVRENFLYMRPGFALSDDDDLLRKGVVDSMGVVEMLEFLQEEFEVTVEDEEITEQNLGSLAAIATYVVKKTG